MPASRMREKCYCSAQVDHVLIDEPEQRVCSRGLSKAQQCFCVLLFRLDPGSSRRSRLCHELPPLAVTLMSSLFIQPQLAVGAFAGGFGFQVCAEPETLDLTEEFFSE